MAVGPDHVGVDQGRALARAAVGRRRLQRLDAGQHVAAVDLADQQVGERGDELADAAARRVDLDGHRDGVAVVLDHEDDRQLQVAGAC